MDRNVQRAHDEQRSSSIRDFVKFGFPWCEMTESKRTSEEFSDLQKPGWLPTAIVLNILAPGDKRDGASLDAADAITISGTRDQPRLLLPKSFDGPKWRTKSIAPLEVIDGQHRLWAFDDFDQKGDFELPVVAFNGLDRSWQAYLFWSINITPKRIKQSLAFDLYPLLRQEDWLERFAGHSIYRETRAQELVEALWSHPDSPWKDRINMLGESGHRWMVSQAAWIRSLLATFVKKWNAEQEPLGGLFGAMSGNDTLVLEWTRAQQAAFLIAAGAALRKSVGASKEKWAEAVRSEEASELFPNERDLAFFGPSTLLSTDQGIRGFLSVTNDLFCVMAEELELAEWRAVDKAAATDEAAVSEEMASIAKQGFAKTLSEIARGLGSFDWRTSSSASLDDDQRRRKLAYRGSSGYKQLREDLLNHIERVATGAPLRKAATRVKKELKL